MAAATYGKTWWGLQWLNSLNNIDYSNRLPRGKTYANKGAVEKIKIRDNHIEARVSGSRTRPYKVDIYLPPFFDPELSGFIAKLAARPTIISKMLNRQLDPEVLAIAEEAGLKVFPEQWTDFKMMCSCPDWAVPCKHLAAVIYKVSAEIDNNPFLVFELHNVDLISELEKIGISINRKTAKVPRLFDLYFDKKKKKKEDYHPEDAYKKIPFSGLSPLLDPLLALLQEEPAFYHKPANFKDKYAKKLKMVVSNAQKVLKGKISLENLLLKAYHEEKENLSKREENTVVIDRDFHSRIMVNDNEFSLFEYLYQLAKIPNRYIYDYQPSTAILHTLLHTAVHLLANGTVVPQVVQLPNKKYAVRWLPALLTKEVRPLVEKLEGMLPPDIFLWQREKSSKVINQNVAFNLLSLIITELISELNGIPSDDVFVKLFFEKFEYDFKQPGEEALAGGAMAWLQKYFITEGRFKPSIAVEELANENFLIKLEIKDKTQSFAAPVPLQDIIREKQHQDIRYEILQQITRLSPFIKGLDEFINSKGERKIIQSNENFTPFLIEMVPIIQLLDIDMLLPRSLQQILKPKASLKLKREKDGSKSFIGLGDIFGFDWRVAIGDEVMDDASFKKLMNSSEKLIKFKSNYMYVTAGELEKLHKHFTQAKDLSPMELLRIALSDEYNGAKIELTDEVRDLIKELTEFNEIPVPEQLKARLRPYQNRGYSWMYRNAKIGFGSVLADDMGLGKTLQVISTLLKFKEEGLLDGSPAMVVAPTGLITNWEAEIEKFAPSLKSKIYHGNNRKLNGETFDVLLTSYGIVRSDAKNLKKKQWTTVVIDEAQNIKNLKTAQTKAVKSIPAQNFIAMSGTPVENRLSELYSIFDYSNRGFLGSTKDFNEEFGVPIQQYNDEEVAGKLKKVTAPFMMRRLKTDKSIISDLPEKIERDAYAVLTKKQAVLYEQTLEKAMKDIEGMEATDQKALFVRQGLVLQMMLALKQVCNHPTQFLKNNQLNASLSGKIELLFDITDSIVESGEKALIFTQFTEMGKLLKYFITERYGEEPLFYHGGVNINRRKEMVSNFQDKHADKLFILSLKAAGTGLNLTRANHVIHYDLWWNPAVEAQATDRAFRIGQSKNVMVHRFITKNTFEEKINEMIQGKKALAEMTVSTGENWIGNMSNRELRDVFGR